MNCDPSYEKTNSPTDPIQFQPEPAKKVAEIAVEKKKMWNFKSNLGKT